MPVGGSLAPGVAVVGRTGGGTGAAGDPFRHSGPWPRESAERGVPSMRAGRGSDLRDGVGTDRGRRGILAWVVFGLALGIVGWGGFNTAMDAPN